MILLFVLHCGPLFSFHSGLIVRKGKPEEVISQMISQIGKQNTQAIVFSEEVRAVILKTSFHSYYFIYLLFILISRTWKAFFMFF